MLDKQTEVEVREETDREYLLRILEYYKGTDSEGEDVLRGHNIVTQYIAYSNKRRAGTSIISTLNGELYMWGFRDKRTPATASQYLWVGRQIANRYEKLNIIARQNERYVIILAKKLKFKKVNCFLGFIHFRKG